MLNERVNLLVKRSTNAIDNNKILVHKLTQMEQERDALRMMIGSEKQKVLDMQTLLHHTRAPLASNITGSPSSVHASADHASSSVPETRNIQTE